MSFTGITRLALARGMIAILLGSGPVAAAAEPALADCAQNAAFHYWKAASLIQTPASRDELEWAGKADFVLSGIAPEIFRSEPELLQWLLSNTAVPAVLNRARTCAISEFQIRTSGDPFLDLSHLPRLRALTRRAHATAKAYEFVDNEPGAAAIHVALLKMVQHLDQDRNVVSGSVATELLDLNFTQLESFLSRSQSADALAPLVEYFSALPSPVFHPDKYLRDESRRFSDWLLADPARPEERLNRLYRNTKSKPAIERLMTLDPQRKKERLKGWVNDYRERMLELADAMDLPFASGLPRIRSLDEQRETSSSSASGSRDNPLVPLLVPAGTDLYERFLLAEAQFGMLQILCAAAACRAETGFWPADIDAVSRHARQTMPKDPFSGEKFYYRLDRGMPVMITRVPKKMLSEKKQSHSVSLHQRLRSDEDNTADMRKSIRDKEVRAMNERVPMQ